MDKLKFLFLIGVEGTGHHMIHALLESHAQQQYFVQNGIWRNSLESVWDVNPVVGPVGKVRNVLKLKGSEQVDLKVELKEVFDKLQKQGITHMFESTSFPFNHPRNTLRRPDILQLIETLDGLVEYKFLVLYRNPVSAAFSGLRRKFTDNTLLQAKIVEDNLIYIASQLSTVNKDLYKVLNFEEFLEEPKSYVGQLASWWNLQKELLEKDLNNIYRPTQLKEIPSSTRETLEGFFTSMRVCQWQQFYDGNRLKTS